MADQFGVMILLSAPPGKAESEVVLRLAEAIGKPGGGDRRSGTALSGREIAGLRGVGSARRWPRTCCSPGGRFPKQFAGALAINPVADFIALHEDLSPAAVEQTPDEALRKLRAVQWPALRKMCEGEFGGPPDAARAEYHLRSPVLFASELATVPLILYWAEDDELIPNGATHQGGMLARVIRDFQPASLEEVKHIGGHGYPFYGIDLSSMTVKFFPRAIFLESVQKMLDNHGR